MDEKKHSIYRVRYCLWFQASTGGPGMYPLQIKGNYYNKYIMQQYILLSQKNKQVTPNGKKSYTSQREIFK